VLWPSLKARLYSSQSDSQEPPKPTAKVELALVVTTGAEGGEYKDKTIEGADVYYMEGAMNLYLAWRRMMSPLPFDNKLPRDQLRVERINRRSEYGSQHIKRLKEAEDAFRVLEDADQNLAREASSWISHSPWQ